MLSWAPPDPQKARCLEVLPTWSSPKLSAQRYLFCRSNNSTEQQQSCSLEADPKQELAAAKLQEVSNPNYTHST